MQRILNGMRRRLVIVGLVPLSALVFAQSGTKPASFEVASVRPSQHEVGPDYNNQITFSAGEFTGKNVTLRRLVAEAWHCQMSQVIGPQWLDRNEYDVEAREPEGTSGAQTALMLRDLLSERFHLKEHADTRLMRIYELTVDKGGPKIKATQAAEETKPGPGFHFHGDMRQLADLLTIQFSIPAPESPNVPVKAGGSPMPVLDKTGLQGSYDFTVDIRPEPGTDMFAAWKRALEDQVGLKIESQKTNVPVVVVDDALKVPTEN